MVTVMPKPDLVCLVQLLDGTIETFGVNVRNTNKHTLTVTSLALWRLYVAHLGVLALFIVSCMMEWQTILSFSH